MIAMMMIVMVMVMVMVVMMMVVAQMTVMLMKITMCHNMRRLHLTFDASDVVQKCDGVKTVQCTLAISFILRHSVLVDEPSSVPVTQ